jgi:hypothetical protein
LVPPEIRFVEEHNTDGTDDLHGADTKIPIVSGDVGEAFPGVEYNLSTSIVIIFVENGGGVVVGGFGRAPSEFEFEVDFRGSLFRDHEADRCGEAEEDSENGLHVDLWVRI